MTPRLEEAVRLLRLAKRDQLACEALLQAEGLDLAVALFHAQQAVEKALKAAMCVHGLEFRRTHDLEELAGKLADSGVVLPADVDEFALLTPYAVQYRYDDEAVALISSTDAVKLMESVLDWANAKVSGHM